MIDLDYQIDMRLIARHEHDGLFLKDHFVYYWITISCGLTIKRQFSLGHNGIDCIGLLRREKFFTKEQFKKHIPDMGQYVSFGKFITHPNKYVHHYGALSFTNAFIDRIYERLNIAQGKQNLWIKPKRFEISGW
jgi:hypothetical protein